jgi:hypothetical protein
MQQAYKFTRIVSRDATESDRYIAVQSKTRTIIYDIANYRCRTTYAVYSTDIWESLQIGGAGTRHVGPVTHVLVDMREREFIHLTNEYPSVMSRLHATPDSQIMLDRRWEDAFSHRYAKVLGLPPALPNNTCRIDGRSVSPHTFIRIKKYRQELTAAIAAREQGDVFDCLQSLHDVFGSGYLITRAMDAVNEMGWMDDDICLADCGHLTWHNDTATVEGEQWCPSCFEDEAVYVENRDEYVRRGNAYEHSNGCYYSYEEANDEDDDDNDDDDEPTQLMGYATNVLRHITKDDSIKSSPFGNFLMGVELEMCSGSRSTVDNAVRDVLAQFGDDYCICKSDGSLPDDGLEIVTAPRGLAEHIERFKKWNINTSYRAWNNNRCGMHVHIDANAFSQLTLGKFLIFINTEDNKDFIRKIAGRHPAIDMQAQRYCAMDGQEQLANPKTAVKGKSNERYYMVNLANLTSAGAVRLGLPDWKFSGKYNTVELRIFRASLKKERLLAQLEFTHAAVMFVRAASYRELTGGAFVTWLKKYNVLYPHLAAWYGVAPIKKANPNTTPVVSSDETVSA